MDIEMLKVMESLLDEKLEPIKENINSLKSEINSIKMSIQSLLEFQCNTKTSSSADSYRFIDNHIDKRATKPSVEAIWLEAKQVMKKELTEVSYQTWIDPILPVKLEKNIIFLKASSLFSKDIIDNRYLDLIKTAISYVTSKKYDVEVGVINSIENKEKSTLSKFDNKLSTSVFNPKYNFDSFIVGKNNYLAYKSAKYIAENPNENIKFLYIHGSRGMGKTHLMNAIGYYIHTHKPNKKIFYFTINDFTNQMIDSIKKDKQEEFYNSFKDVDILMVDDLQHILGKEKTQEEFYKVISSLLEMDKQVVISSVNPPEKISIQNNRLTSIFEINGVFELSELEFEDKLSILKSKACEKDIKISDEILAAIAENENCNVRELINILNRLKSHIDISGNPIDMKLIKYIIKERLKY